MVSPPLPPQPSLHTSVFSQINQWSWGALEEQWANQVAKCSPQKVPDLLYHQGSKGGTDPSELERLQRSSWRRKTQGRISKAKKLLGQWGREEEVLLISGS